MPASSAAMPEGDDSCVAIGTASQIPALHLALAQPAPHPAHERPHEPQLPGSLPRRCVSQVPLPSQSAQPGSHFGAATSGLASEDVLASASEPASVRSASGESNELHAIP